MPAQIVFGPVKDKIPSDWTSLNIQGLASTNVAEKFALLKVKHRYKHHACRVNRIKMLLEDGDGHVIDFFAFGQAADDLKTCEKGDILLCIEFEVEECPGHMMRPYQIIADDTGEQKSSIWVSKRLSSSQTSSSTHDAENAVVPQRQSPAKCKMTKQQSYSYQALSEVKVNSVVDVYGIVKFVKPAVKGKGSDFYCVVGLIDPSLGKTEEDKLVCVIFHREPDSLPKVEEGDVLRLHRLRIQTYQGGKQGYNGPGFQWLAFHGSVDRRTFSSSMYTFEDQDKEKAGELLDWWSEQCQNQTMFSPGMKSGSKKMTSLAGVKPKDYFDCICQVVKICVLDPDVCRLLRVWDGTKCEVQLKEVTDGELNQSLQENRLLVRASAGLTVDIFLFDNHAMESNDIKPGDYLLLTNVHSSVVAGLVELTIHGGGHKFKRGFQVLPTNNTEVRALKAKLDQFVTKLPEDSNNSSLSVVPSAHVGQTARSSSGKDCVALCSSGSQAFVPGENNTLDSDYGTDLTANDPVSRLGALPAPTGSDMEAYSGQKDSPSKNKSLKRRRLILNADNVSSSCSMTVQPVEHQRKEGALHVERNEIDDEVDEEDKRDSTGESSQSIWLSIYNDSNNESPDEGNSPLTSERTLQSVSKGTTDRNRREKLMENESAFEWTQKNQYKATQEEETSSQASFVTAPSPSSLRAAGLFGAEKQECSDTAQVRSNSIALPGICAEGQGQPQKRRGEELEEDCGKRTKPSYQGKEGRIRMSERNVKRKGVKNLEETKVQNRANKSYGRDKFSERQKEVDKNGEDEARQMEREGIPHTFSQSHLEILDSQMLCFDTNEFSQIPEMEGKRSNLTEGDCVVQDTELPVQNEGEAEKRYLRPRRRLHKEKASHMSQQQWLCSSSQEAQDSTEARDTQPASLSQVEQTQKKEMIQSPKDSQDFLQVDHGDDHVTSSSDSLKSSQSQPRCMLRTASVVLDHPDVPLSSVKEVLEHPPPHKFRIQVKVERVEPRPSVPQDLVYFLCSQCKYFSRMDSSQIGSGKDRETCPRCVGSPPTLRPVTVLVLQLSDEHDTISASVWDKNADQFFGGLSSHQLLRDENCFRQVQHWLTSLCPLGSTLESRPVLECCVCSYYVDGQIKLQIFDTSLI